MRSSTPILVYHAVGDCPKALDKHRLFVSITAFAAQMDYLSRHKQVVPLQVAIERPAEPRRVAITFDDAYRSVLTNAVPVLKRRGFPATMFAPTKWLGSANAWDPPSDCDLEIMGDEELRRAAEAGLDIQSHGHAHLDLRRAAPAEAREDIEQSIGALRSLLGAPPRYFAYPYGRNSLDLRRLVQDLGFEAALSVNASGHDRFSIPRVRVTQWDSRTSFAFKVSGRYELVRSAPLLRGGRDLARAAVGRVKPGRQRRR